MPINGQSIGKDVSFVIVFQGQKVAIPANAVTGFEPKPRTSTENRQGLDGGVRDAVYPNGWEGTIDVDRLDPTVENFWAQIEDQYYSGQNVGTGTISETETNPDGSISKWRYKPVVFRLDTVGERKPDSVIKQRLSWFAGRRLAV